ncbi:hypothetical protein LguiA_033669 [Lonicera macranthoides]
MEHVEVVAELAVRCLNRSGVFRPDVNEVAESLLRLKKLNNNNGGVGDQSTIEKMQSLLSYHNNAQMLSLSFETEYITSLDIQPTPSTLSGYVIFGARFLYFVDCARMARNSPLRVRDEGRRR